MVGKKALGYVRIDTPGERRLFWFLALLLIASHVMGGGDTLWGWLGFLLGTFVLSTVVVHAFRAAGRLTRLAVGAARNRT